MNNPNHELLTLKTRLIETQKICAIVTYLNKTGHETNNHVATISAGLQLSRAKFQKTDSIYKIIERSFDSCNQIAKTFKHFQFFKQFIKMKPTDFPVTELISEVIELVRFNFSSRQLTFKTESASESAQINGDREQLFLALYHVLINAVEASDKQTETMITINVSAYQNDETTGITIEISDNGKGISETVKPQLFVPFVTTKMEYASGLGLFLVHSIITDHGGKVTIDSSENGTTVRLFIP